MPAGPPAATNSRPAETPNGDDWASRQTPATHNARRRSGKMFRPPGVPVAQGWPIAVFPGLLLVAFILFFGFFITGTFIGRLVAAGTNAVNYFFAAFLAR